ncbi:MAG: hypothetical protein ACI3VR_12320 [Intestinibacter sp.]|uniref:hypothetical protein n=1 Tax=Intestinibacter sp. TaxID=1965304 RepID=UPI003F13DBAB
MNQKPSLKQIGILNVVNNIPMAIIMSTAAPLLGGQNLQLNNWIMNVIIAFVIACIINLVVPVGLIANKFPTLFKLDSNKLPGRIIGNIPVAFIFVVIIGLILTYYNVRLVPIFIFAFLGTFIPLYLICFVVSMITNPVAMKLAGMEN